MTVTAAEAGITLRKPVRVDGKHVYQLVRDCPPLDRNSCYAYLLLCEHFGETSVVAERKGRVVGCVTGYRRPGAENTLFVWQVAVDARARGLGLGGLMLRELIERPSDRLINFLETTVSPSNRASMRMFEKFAEYYGAACEQRVLFGRHDFDSRTHEEEVLLRIGPLSLTVPKSPERIERKDFDHVS